jgi:hypothetical protein
MQPNNAVFIASTKTNETFLCYDLPKTDKSSSYIKINNFPGKFASIRDDGSKLV